MKHTYKVLVTLLSSSFFLSSCEKEAPRCTGNCETINIAGKVIDKLANTGATDVPVTLSWSRSVYTSQNERINKVNSKSDGTFSFTSNIDTSYFSRGYSLSLYVNSNTQYSILGYSGLIALSSNIFNPNPFQNAQFEVYKKAKFKIRLHRTLNDNFLSYTISHSNVSDFFLSDYFVQSPQDVINQNTTELNVETVADVYTKIRTIKNLTNGTLIISLDSIKCTTNSTSTYDVTF